MRITEPTRGIYKCEVPFEDIYTAVFILTEGDEYLILDAATTPKDADEVILPALKTLGLAEKRPSALLLTHRHGDHAGGAKRLTEAFSGLSVYSPEECRDVSSVRLYGGEVFLGCIEAVMLPGHTDTSMGYFDRRSGTLISGDCLQQKGVSRYTNGIKDRDAYLASVEKIRMMRLSRILASHEYVPLGSVAEGETAVSLYLDECVRDA